MREKVVASAKFKPGHPQLSVKILFPDDQHIAEAALINDADIGVMA